MCHKSLPSGGESVAIRVRRGIRQILTHIRWEKSAMPGQATGVSEVPHILIVDDHREIRELVQRVH